MLRKENTEISGLPSASLPMEHRTAALTVRADVEDVMCFHTSIDTPDFVDTFFPKNSPLLEPVVNHVFSQIKRRKLWRTSDNAWKGLPKKPERESELYTPLTAILKEITRMAVQFCRIHKHGSPSSITWSDEHSKDIPSPFAADTRPDIVASFMEKTSWRFLHVILVMKKARYLAAASNVFRLLQYIRMVLEEQVDRRFMFGMMFGKGDLSIWLVDRSGAIASEPFDIHEDPEQFIRIVVGLTLLPRADLGWDPTMQIYIPPEIPGRGQYGSGRYSYEVGENSNLSPMDTTYKRMWVVSMNKPFTNGASDLDQDKFVLYHALSLARAEVLCGRATRIWLAWKFTDMDLPVKERTVYVFKDVWRDERRGLEGELYAKAFVNGNSGDGIAKVHSFGTVRVGQEVDDTLNLIRKKVPVKGKAIKLLPDRSPNDKRIDLFGYKAPLLDDTIHLWSQNLYKFEVADHRSPYNRIHSRLVMSTFGWSIRYFKSLPEVMGVMRDAIAGHQFLFKQGVLHRDISYGNILIVPDGKVGNRGVLIDLDFAIEWEDHKRRKDDERSGTLTFMSAEVISKSRYFSLDPVYRKGLKRDNDDNDDNDSGVYDIDSDDNDNHGDSSTSKGSSTTMPDSQALNQRSRGVKHQPIHDLESFFWVLCWLFVYRDGPPHARSNWGASNGSATKLQQALVDVFETTDLLKVAEAKRGLVKNEALFETTLLKNFTDFCAPLRREIRTLYTVLGRAYKNSKRLKEYPVESLYRKFLRLFDAAQKRSVIVKHNTTNADYIAHEEAETHRRETQLEIWATTSSDKKRKYTEDEEQASRSTPADHPVDAPDVFPPRKTRRPNHPSGP